MEINNKMLDNKITMVIKDNDSQFVVNNCYDISILLEKKNIKSKIISINDINDIKFHDFSVFDIINKFMSKYNKKGKKFMHEVLRLSTLSLDYLNKDPFELNDSEKFKLILALVLMLNPSTIVINNMSCYLDNKSCNDIMFTLKKLKRDYKKTIFIIDNDVDYMFKVCDNVIILSNNELLLHDKKEKIYDNYAMLKRRKISFPIYIEFLYKAKKSHVNDMLIRDDVKDIMKDIYRSL